MEVVGLERIEPELLHAKSDEKKIQAAVSALGPWGGAGVNIQRASVIRDENKIQSRNYGNNSNRNSST